MEGSGRQLLGKAGSGGGLAFFFCVCAMSERICKSVFSRMVSMAKEGLQPAATSNIAPCWEPYLKEE